jgi:benzoate/toluate 1,2-dioxygenase beta subunit
LKNNKIKMENLLYLEADLLDRQQWSDWSALYVEDCVIWVPAWDSEEVLVDDPEISVNMMYLVGKPALEARLHRIASDDAYASLPLARTMHAVTNIRVVEDRGAEIDVSSKFTVLSLEPRRGKSWRGGWYDHTLVEEGGALRIKRKKITLLEDVIDGTVDLYQI